jgi:hypothetical protein
LNEVRANLVRFGIAEAGVQHQGTVPVAACQVQVACRAGEVAEAIVGSCLFQLVPDRTGQLERGVIPDPGFPRLAGGLERLAESVERLGFHRPARRYHGTLVMTLYPGKTTEPVKSYRLSDPVATAPGGADAQVYMATASG